MGFTAHFIKKRISISDVQLRDEMVKLFESGRTDITELLVLIRSKFKMGNGRYFKIANEALLEWRELREKSRSEQIQANAKEGLKKAVMTADERREYLTKVIKGETRVKQPFVIGGKVVEYSMAPGHADIQRAVAELNKMGGDYAPTKVAQTNSKGEDLPTINIIMPPDEGS